MRQPPGPDDPTTVGRFRVVGVLGSGGMGRVLLGEDPSGRLAAVKLVHADLVDDDGFRARFRREVRLAAQAPPGWTAPFLDADPDAPRPWLATAYLDAPSLLEHLAERGPYSPGGAAELGAGLAAALSALHGAGLVHRDLKPSNVLLTDGGPRLIDFGISRAVDGTALTATGQSVGTPEYMSPEQVVGAEAGPPTDVFSLASLLVFAVRNRTPFAAGSPTGALYRVVHDEPDLAPELGPLLPVLRACLAKDPAGRPRAPELRDRLAAVDPTSAGPPATVVGGPGGTWADGSPPGVLHVGGADAGAGGEESGPPAVRPADTRVDLPGFADSAGPDAGARGVAPAGPTGYTGHRSPPSAAGHDAYRSGHAAAPPDRFGYGAAPPEHGFPDGGPPPWSPPGTLEGPPTGRRHRTPDRRRTLLLAAGAALLAVVLGVGGTLAVLALRPDPGTVAEPVADGPANPFLPPSGSAAPSAGPSDLAAGATVVNTSQDIRYGDPSDTLVFTSPSGNISCAQGPFDVRCDVTERTWQVPPRPGTCQQAFGTGAELAGSAPAALTCVGDTIANPGLPALDYGTALRTREVTCVSRQDGVECRNSSTGHGFTVSRGAYRLY